MSTPTIVQNNVAQTFVFQMVDLNGEPKTGLTPISATFTLNGALLDNASSVTEVGGGDYSIDCVVATCGILILRVTATGAQPTFVKYDVLPTQGSHPLSWQVNFDRNKRSTYLSGRANGTPEHGTNLG
jgi:hypothetical protein